MRQALMGMGNPSHADNTSRRGVAGDASRQAGARNTRALLTLSPLQGER